MRKIKFFFRVLWRSITDISYYKEIRKARFRFSLKYIFFWHFLISLVFGIALAVKIASFIPQIPDFISMTEANALDFYPEELVVTVKDSKISTNVQEPYFISFPAVFDDLTQESDLDPYSNFVVIDTAASVEDYPEYESVVLVTDESVVYPDDDRGGYRVYPIKDSPASQDFVLDRSKYEDFVAIAIPYLDLLPILAYIGIALSIFLLPFTAAVFRLIGILFFLLWASFILWLVARLLKRRFTYGEFYRLSMHGITLALVVSWLAGLISISLGLFWFFVIYAAYMIYVSLSFKRS